MVRPVLAWTILCGMGLVAMIVAAVRDPSPFMVQSAFVGGPYIILVWLIGLPFIALFLRLRPMPRALVAWTAVWIIGFVTLVFPEINEEATLEFGPPPIFGVAVVIWLIGLVVTGLVTRWSLGRARGSR